MQEVGHQLQTMKESAEAQKECFRIEIEELREQVQEMEINSAKLEKELGLFKAKEQKLGESLDEGTLERKKSQAQPMGQQSRESSGQSAARSPPTLGKELGQSTHANTNRQRPSSEGLGESPDCRPSSSSPAANNAPTVPRAISGIKSAKPATISYAQVAASNVTQSRSNNSWTEVTSSNRKRKSNAASPPKVEPEKRRFIFRERANSPQKSEADLMLVLNESLQKAGVPAYVRFSRVGYSQSGAVSGLLTERSNAEDLIKQHSNTLIRAAKSVDEGVIGVEALERWHRLKVHGMPLLRYFGEGRMEVLSREIESSTGI